MIRRVCVCLCLVLLAAIPQGALAQAGRPPAPSAAELAALGLAQRDITVRGVKRSFLVLPPQDSSRPSPVLVLLHGGTQSMRRLFAPNAGATRGWPILARQNNLLLLVPNGTNADTGDAAGDNQNWNDLREGVSRESKADDVGFILALLDWGHASYRTDRGRVYVTGASNGGMMTFRLLMEASQAFSAGATFVAALPEQSARIKVPAKPVPLLIANGTLDPLVQWNGGMIAGNRGRMRSVEATVDWWIAANRANRSAVQVSQLPDRHAGDGCRMERRTYPAGPDGAPLVTLSMIGGGHALPSARYSIPDNWFVRRYIGPVCRDAEGVELIWDFLSAHSSR